MQTDPSGDVAGGQPQLEGLAERYADVLSEILGRMLPDRLPKSRVALLKLFDVLAVLELGGHPSFQRLLSEDFVAPIRAASAEAMAACGAG